MPSESRIRWSSNSTSAGRAGRVPVAMTTCSAADLCARRAVAGRRPATVCGSRNRPVPADEVDAVADQLVADDLDLAADDVLGAAEQVGDGDVVLDPVVLAVELALVHAGQVEHGLAQGLGRDGAGVDADPADHAAGARRRRPACRAWPPRWPPSARRARSRSRAGRSRSPRCGPSCARAGARSVLVIGASGGGPDLRRVGRRRPPRSGTGRGSGRAWPRWSRAPLFIGENGCRTGAGVPSEGAF